MFLGFLLLNLAIHMTQSAGLHNVLKTKGFIRSIQFVRPTRVGHFIDFMAVFCNNTSDKMISIGLEPSCANANTR